MAAISGAGPAGLGGLWLNGLGLGGFRLVGFGLGGFWSVGLGLDGAAAGSSRCGGMLRFFSGT